MLTFSITLKIMAGDFLKQLTTTLHRHFYIWVLIVSLIKNLSFITFA
ncbi:hypothetical protein PTRA_a1355 [Pseudoalteromonas translucida KMM 520]|uniref:Uncharacterized protein n=1 Tax=Pseudoalteromonas translucida KMM 520 TaxID=1315283 RepID=A0A0U2NFP9_9GAMM|nr:hypothetical protein PTRA_a1355 [Pseudoalteromonas translucida KMM 520]